MTDRVEEEARSHQRNEELCELAPEDASTFWRLFKAPQSNACTVELSALFEAFRALMRAEPFKDTLLQVFLTLALAMHA